MQSFDPLCALIRQLNIHDDAIVMDSKIRDLADLFQHVFDDEQQLTDMFQHFNRVALDDSKFAKNFALFFASRVLDTVLQSGSQFRAEMLTVLQQNFVDADAMKSFQRSRFYNSITLLGEYYHRARIAASPVQILGQSLLQLLADHLCADIERHLVDASATVDVTFAKVIVRQVSLNGQLARPTHKSEIDALLYQIRRCLVLVGNVCTTTRALLLMTLDLYYNNFEYLGNQLESLYVTYLIGDGDDDDDDDVGRTKGERTPTDGKAIIGLHAHTASDDNDEQNTVHSINGLCEQLSKQGSGYQRPAGIKTEFLNRPLRAADRLRFIRNQTTVETEHDNAAVQRQQQAFEETLHQQQEQRRQQQQQQPTRLSEAGDGEHTEPLYAVPLAVQLTSPATSAVSPTQSARHNYQMYSPNNSTAIINRSPMHSPRKTLLANPIMSAPQSPNQQQRQQPQPHRQSNGSDRDSSAPTTPTKSSALARRRPLVAPVSPPENWFADVESHFYAGVQRGASDATTSALSPTSPNQRRQFDQTTSPSHGGYSKSASPRYGQRSFVGGSGGGDDEYRRSGYAHDDDGENDAGRQEFAGSHRSSSRGGGGGRRNGGGGGGGGGGRRQQQSRQRSGHNTDNDGGGGDSRYASKNSLHSTTSTRSKNDNNAKSSPTKGGHGTQLKPANRNGHGRPGEQRRQPNHAKPARQPSHHQHCDRGDGDDDGGIVDRRQHNEGQHSLSRQRYNEPNDCGNGDGGGGPYQQPQQQPTVRNPHAAQYAQEFLQFLDE